MEMTVTLARTTKDITGKFEGQTSKLIDAVKGSDATTHASFTEGAPRVASCAF